MFICRQKSTSSFTFSLRYCKDIANFLFWVLWTYRATHTQNDTENLKKTFVYLQAKNQLHHPRFPGDIAKISKLLILGTLGMLGYANPKWYCQLVVNFDVYLHAKNKLHHFFLVILHFKESCNLIGQQYFGS